MADLKSLESWLHEKAGPAYDALKAKLARTVMTDPVHYTLAKLLTPCHLSAEPIAQERE